MAAVACFLYPRRGSQSIVTPLQEMTLHNVQRVFGWRVLMKNTDIEGGSYQ